MPITNRIMYIRMDVFTYARIFIHVCIYLCTCTERSLACGSERLIAMLSVAAETPSQRCYAANPS